jgi:hypothetical protein
MTSSSIHFFGIDNVIVAAKNRSCPNWGIFQKGQFLFKYEGNNMEESIQLLGNILETIQESAAAYTIKFYEQDGKAVKIKENTACDGSFNFRLIEEEERQERRASYSMASKQVLETLTKINERLERLEDQDMEDEEEEEPENLQSALIGLISQPHKITELISGIKSLLGSDQPAVHQIGNINRVGQNADRGEDPGPGAGDQLSQIEKANRIANVLDALEKSDPQILEHLEKLSAIATNSPLQFKSLISMLNLM